MSKTSSKTKTGIGNLLKIIVRQIFFDLQNTQAMCQTFVENCREDEEQVLLFYYWILDICQCHEELQEQNVAVKCKDCLRMSPDKALLVESLWFLDHRFFKVS